LTRRLALGALVVLGFFAAMGALSIGGYPGGPDECIALGDCYCEAIGPGIAAQPANSWSNLGFVVVGLAVLWDSGRRRPGRSRISTDDRYAVLYGSVAVFLGLGSFAFHGSIRAWGGYVDVLSMHAFLSFVLAYDVARIHDRDWRWFGGWYGGLLAVFGIAIGLLPPEHGKTLFAALVAVALVVEAAVSYQALRPWAPVRLLPRRVPWFWTGLGVFAMANLIWSISRTDGPWCEPDALIQGHALWHILSAISVACFYLYFRGEGGAMEAPNSSRAGDRDSMHTDE
jgi:hypothetical protein